MQAANFTVVRIGEFAWSKEEPSKDHYDFGWLDRAIALAAKHHIAVVLGTPTDAPPAWLTTFYPQTLRVDANGRRAQVGGRRQFNYADPTYRRLCAAIDVQLARRYGHNPNVIGWQIGNEYTDESFDSATRTRFQQFLKAKYKTLANLNARWTTAYWSQTYSSWSQIPMEDTHENPALLLDHKHFVTATWQSFQRNQIDALRPFLDKRQFVTTNIGGLGWSDNWDHYAITADLSLASWDDYVGEGHLDVAKNAMLNDFVRGWKRQNFWVMETEPGSVNWAPINNALYPGETRSLAWQAVGHGADAVLYWQWRSALNGQEQYHGTIVGPDGEANPIYPEISRIGNDFNSARALLSGTSPQSSIALLFDYDSRWAIDFQPHTKTYDQEKVLLRFYTPLERIAESRLEALDIVDPATAPLSGYKLLVAPSFNVISDPLAEKLLAWVRAGGHLLLGPRSGMKGSFDELNIQRQPGPVEPALGGKVEQFYALNHSVGLSSPLLQAPGESDIWAEALSASNFHTEVKMTYIDPEGWLAGKSAMLSRQVGSGTITYLGTLPDATTMQTLMSQAAQSAGVSASVFPPAGIELCMRRSATKAALVVLNHTNAPNKIELQGHYRDVLHQAVISEHNTGSAKPMTSIELPAQGVAVLISEGVTR